MGISIGYETKNGLEIRKKYGQNVQNTQQNQTNSIKKQTSASVASLGNSPASDSFTSGITGNVGSGNACTDGKDDGHIGLFSKVANVAQGVVRSGANMIKAAVKHPVKALAMTAVGFVPVVGPAVLGGLAVYGAVQGAKEVVGAVKLANAADNDADAKAAWEHIGSGAFTTALSVTGAKASAKAVHKQLTGGSSTVDVFREKGFKKETFQEAFKETKANAENFIDAAKAKLEKAKGKIDDFKANKELGNGKEYVKEEVQKYADKKRYGEKAGDVQKAREELKAAKEELNKALEDVNNARKSGSDNISELEAKVARAQEQVSGVSKETYKKAQAKFKEATKDIKDKNSPKYEEAEKAFNDEVHSAKRDYELAKKNNTVKKQKIAQKEAKAKAETDANKTNFEEKVEADLKQQGYEIKLDENGNGVAAKKLGENGEISEVKIENYKEVSKKEVTATTEKSTTDTKTGATLESKVELDADNKVKYKSKKYTGDIGKGEGNKVSYEQSRIKQGDRVYNYETYTVGGKEYTYVDGKPTGAELSFSQRQLLKYNAKHSASKATTVDASVLYAQQAAAALNANRY